jgi:hypothetical protein
MRARFTIAVATVVLASFAALAAQGPSSPRARDDAPELLLGTWKLDVAKSKYSPGPPLKDETRVYTRGADGTKGVVTRTYADGQVEKFEYVANFGGEYMVTGTPAYDAVKLTRVDDFSSQAVLTHAGMVYGVARRVLSPDGKTMTITFDRKNVDTPVHNVAVYHKQP